MFRHLIVGIGVLFLASPLHASGILIAPREPRSPFQRVDQQIRVNLEDQVATTRVEEVFHNPTDRTIEAVYLFPLPKNATVNRFSLWINGAETKGELLDATQAREIYTSIVRKSQDPALLEYLGTNLLRLRVFPIAPKSDQKIALSFTSVCEQADRLVEYLYFQGEGGDLGNTDKVRLKMRIQSQLGLKNIFSPSHSISMNRKSDQEVEVDYEGKPGDPRRHFTLYYSLGKEDVGLTPLFHRSNSSEKGFFGLMISPRFVPSGEVKRIPQDVVLVLDISGSMRGEKLKQAKKAVEKCLQKLQPEDQFGLLAFATGLTPFEDGLKKVGPDSLSRAGKWLGELESSGGTAIDAALQAALDLQPKAKERPFAVVFFTDGQPTIGEINPDRILKNVQGKNQSKTRIFSFGVGDDVNAMLLDKLAENTRAVSTYIREEENIVARVNGLLDKITNPILTNLKLSVAGGKVELQDYYPIELPDLFHGGQLVVFGRYSGQGPAALKLSGQYQKNQKDFVFECQFPEQTTSAREFVEQVWAGRKVGYLLDQIRQNGEQKELKDEVIALARKYGITTPYTSYLVIPDGPIPPTGGPGIPPPFIGVVRGNRVPSALIPRDRDGKEIAGAMGGKPLKVLELAQKPAEERERMKEQLADLLLSNQGMGGSTPNSNLQANAKARETFDAAKKLLAAGRNNDIQRGKLGVDLALQMNRLRDQNQQDLSTVRQVLGRSCENVGGVWVDQRFNDKIQTIQIKAHSNAYYQLLEKRPELKNLFCLGNYLVWITPSGQALVVDPSTGEESIKDETITGLFQLNK